MKNNLWKRAGFLDSLTVCGYTIAAVLNIIELTVNETAVE
jgi:hypothetical protein